MPVTNAVTTCVTNGVSNAVTLPATEPLLALACLFALCQHLRFGRLVLVVVVDVVPAVV